jgi:hypothetical protein
MPNSSTRAPNVRRAIIAIWRTLTRDLSDPYRPELHYMRGPGPKWREKHGQMTPDDVGVGPMTEATMSEVTA